MKNNTLGEIQRLQKERDERRKAAEQFKQERFAEEQRNKVLGTPGDIDFQRMIRQYRDQAAPLEQRHDHFLPSDVMKICIVVRKRPISSKEIKRHDYDSVTCLNPLVVVHDCKFKVDGISKYLENTNFEVDHTFNENNNTEEVYYYTVQPLVQFALNGGRATVFAYGQTGSGKTFTMQGIQSYMVEDLFNDINSDERYSNVLVLVSYFEIYGGRCQDLLNNRERLNIREDGGGEVVLSDLLEVSAYTVSDLQSIIDTGNKNRTTHATESNDESSRSHAVCQIMLRHAQSGKLVGKLSLIDLAGSERGADTKSHNRQRRMEGAEINKSLLALKECIRALDGGSSHVPYRASKLTLVLKDSFTRSSSRTVMIANVSPAASSADHTQNTLRYADRVKERVVGGQANRNAAAGAGGAGPSPTPVPAPALPPSQRRAEGPGPQTRSPPPAPQGPAPLGPGDRDREGRVQPPSSRHFHVDDQHSPGENDLVDELHRTVQDLFDEEEELLNMHMNIIQENAELLTEEGRLLQQIQGEDYDIDSYTARLDVILQRKEELIKGLKGKLVAFRQNLVKEEITSRKLGGYMPSY